MPSDRDLGIHGQWFTGRQWADGTAQRESILEFNRKSDEYLARRQQRGNQQTQETEAKVRTVNPGTGSQPPLIAAKNWNPH